jgi:hypothetical protein
MKKTVETDKEEYKCEHCGRNFVRPSTLLKHLCEEKRRWDERERPANRIGYNAWLKFYQRIQPSRKKKDYKDFSASAYYRGFVKFGLYCADINAVNPGKFTDWLLDNGTPIDSWPTDTVYSKYLTEHLRGEDVMDAVHRSVETLLDISEAEHIQMGDVFRFVNVNKLCQKIATGKISPWIVYHSDTGIEFLSRLNEDHRGLIYEYINPEIWQVKFLRYPESVLQAKSIIKEIRGL